MKQTSTRRTLSGATVIALTLTGALAAAAPAASAPRDHLVAHYLLDETSGTAAADSSGRGHNATYVGGPTLAGGEGVRLDGSDDYVDLPDDLLSGLSSLTVSTDVLVRSDQATPYMIYAFGNTADGAGNGYVFATGDVYRASAAAGNWSTEQRVSSGAALERGVWKTITYTLDDASDTARLYLDGEQVAQATGVTTKPGDIGGGRTTANYLGRSVYDADRRLAGSLRDVRVYDAALSATEVAALTPSDAVRLQRDAAALSLGDLSAVTKDLGLPATGPNGAAVTWATSDAAVVTAAGQVTRPAAGQPAATATLTAGLARGDAKATRTFAVTVAPAASGSDLAKADLDAIVIPGASDVRGNITLPAEGSVNGTAITWSASPAGVITTSAAGGRAAGVVTRGTSDTKVTLTASAAGSSATRAIDVTVKAAPAGIDKDYTAGYLWPHFEAEGGYEKIFLGYSADGLHWKKLNDNKPILSNLGGDLGVRDPHLVRSRDGDKYWIIGTDLHAEGGGPGGSGWNTNTASQNLVVWESTDLVNWSDQRIVFAGFDTAGNVWAPEAIWDEESGQYYIYWSASDQRDIGTADSVQRVYLSKTRDFTTFTTPEIWVSLNERGDGKGGRHIIDSTLAKEGDTWYRFSTSEWDTVVDAAPSLDGPWTRKIDVGQATSHGLRARMEGLTAYQLPDGRWAVMGDEFSYYAHTADTLASLKFTQLSTGSGADQYSFDQKFRHGSVIRLSAAEQQRVLAKYGGGSVQPGQPEEPMQGPVAEYTFDDGTLADSVGDKDLTASGTAAVATDAQKGRALRLTGASGGYASFPQGFFDGRNTMTVSMDVKSEKAKGDFFTFAFGKDQAKYSFLRVRGGEARAAITQSSWQDESAVTAAVSSGEWHHYDVVYDGTSMALYVDGTKVGEDRNLKAQVSDLGASLSGYLGRSLYAADGHFQGWYDNVRVFNRALSDSELLQNAGVEDRLLDVSLTRPEALKLAPVVKSTDRTVLLPVAKGTDLTKLAPTFKTVPGSTVSPASGTVVDLSKPVAYVLTTASGEKVTWTVQARPVNSPVLAGLYADPNIAVFGDTYYTYATSDGFPGWGGKDFYVWKSKDLVDWQRSERPFLTLDGASGNVPWATGNAWAPTIIERGGKYYFYFSGHNPTYDRKTIGVAVASSPEGPFTAQPSAMVVNNEAVTSGQAIDPAAFRDPATGKYYLGWGNGSPVLAELSDDMVSIKPGTYQRINGLTDFREGVFFNYRNGLYHLTYAIDDTGSEDYRVGYATATSMSGPWTYRGVILEKDLSQGIRGPGHSSIINVPGTDDWYIAYHRMAIPSGDGNHRETTIDRLTFGSDGLMQKVTPTLWSVPAQVVPATGPKLAAESAVRCVAGKVTLTVRATNQSQQPVSLAVSSAYGTRSVASLAAGQSTSQAFSTRAASVPAGTATVTATASSAGGKTVVQAAHPALRCG